MKICVLIPLYLMSMLSETNFTNKQEKKRKKTEIAVMEFILSEKSLELYREIWSKRFWRAPVILTLHNLK